MKKSKTGRDRLVGGLGGGGGALLLSVLFTYLLEPSRQTSTWLMNLFFVIIGTSMVSAAVFTDLKNRTKSDFNN